MGGWLKYEINAHWAEVDYSWGWAWQWYYDYFVYLTSGILNSEKSIVIIHDFIDRSPQTQYWKIERLHLQTWNVGKIEILISTSMRTGWSNSIHENDFLNLWGEGGYFMHFLALVVIQGLSFKPCANIKNLFNCFWHWMHWVLYIVLLNCKAYYVKRVVRSKSLVVVTE